MPEDTSLIAENEEYKVYRRRWFVLFVVAGLNITNGALWISFASIVNTAASYYSVSSDAINWFSIVFFITSIPCGILATKLADSKGLKIMIQIGAWTNLIGATLRLLSSLNFMPEHMRYPVAMVGQVIAAVAQSFIFIIPTRVSEVWFPESQRTVSTTVASMANPFGTGLGSLISPFIVNSKLISWTDMDLICIINAIWAIFSLFFALLAFCGIRTSEPPTPPSKSAKHTQHTQSYLVGIKQIFIDKQYIILFITLGVGIAILNAVQIMIDQFLCPKGYSSEFAGTCGALLTGCGIIGAIISGTIAVKTNKLEEITKVCFAFAAVFATLFVMSTQLPRNDYFVGLTCALFGTFAFAGYPIALELAAEQTYPVNETVSAGFILMSGQIQGILYVLIMTAISRPISAKDMAIQTCVTGWETIGNIPQEMSIPGYFVSAVIVIVISGFIIFFKVDYKRMRVEHLRIVESILGDPSGSVEESSSIYG